MVVSEPSCVPRFTSFLEVVEAVVERGVSGTWLTAPEERLEVSVDIAATMPSASS